MRYIILTKLEYPSSMYLRVKGLSPYEIKKLSEKFNEKKVKYINTNDDVSKYLEVNLIAIDMLNILAKEFAYKVVSQAMAMEVSELGGRSFQIEKISWTLEQVKCPHSTSEELDEIDYYRGYDNQKPEDNEKI